MRFICSRNNFPVFLLCCSMMLIISSCASLNQKQLVYTTSERRELSINLPYGQGEENYKTTLDGATEQMFSYKDGSLVYVARNTTWPTPNGARVKQSGANSSTNLASGRDEKGLYWKEMQVEGFTVGYAAVPSSRVERFDKALHSIRLKD
ncbi:MAG: hypothetical protein J7527_03410 [Chitinophagaceae bacterium]|nr:hypothetical protein [Chitinophagaceae bacterium]